MGDTAVQIWVNGVMLSTISAAADGSLSFRLRTTAGTDEGGYYATVIQGENRITAGFILTSSAPTRPVEGGGSIIDVPDGIAYKEFRYLLNILGETRPELVEGRWFRQAQPTPPHFFEKIRI